jgi:hypothetical protein
LTLALLEDAVFLRDDLVQKLDRVVRVAAQAVNRAKFDRLLPLGGREDQTCHQCAPRLADGGSLAQRKLPGAKAIRGSGTRKGARKLEPGKMAEEW